MCLDCTISSAMMLVTGRSAIAIPTALIASKSFEKCTKILCMWWCLLYTQTLKLAYSTAIYCSVLNCKPCIMILMVSPGSCQSTALIKGLVHGTGCCSQGDYSGLQCQGLERQKKAKHNSKEPWQEVSMRSWLSLDLNEILFHLWSLIVWFRHFSFSDVLDPLKQRSSH